MDKNEIICISSDDEEPVPKNGSNDKLSENTERVQNKDYINVKLEALLSKEKTKESNGQKRKISEASFVKSSGYLKKRIKLVSDLKLKNVEHKEMDINSNATEYNIAGARNQQEKIRLMPMLTIKEVKSIARVEQDPFPMFLSLCLQKDDHSEDMKCIVNKLKRRYDSLDQSYASSEAFINFLNEKRTEITNSRHELFRFINDVMIEMKNSCKGRSALLLRKKDSKGKASNLSPSTSNNAYYRDTIEHNTEDTVENDHFKKILKAMKECQRRIKKYETTEIDFDDENNSHYIKVEKYKHRMVELYNKYCEYTGANTDAERPYLRPKHFSATGIVAVDQAITSFINSKILAGNKKQKIGDFTKLMIFPDYSDILRCIAKCNELHNLNLDKKSQEQIAKKAFTHIGEHLQRDRLSDYWDTFSLFFENDEEDPALEDPALAEKLLLNKKEGDKRMTSVFDEYVKKQVEKKEEPGEEDTTSVEDNNEDNSLESETEDSTEEVSNSDARLSMEELSTDEENNNKDSLENSTNENDIIESDEHDFEKDKPSSGVEKNRERSENTNETTSVENKSEVKEDDAPNSSETDNNPTEALNSKDNTNTGETIKDKEIASTKETETVLVDNRISEENLSSRASEEIKNKPLEEDKPLLRVRSFAKPPTTWEDGRAKVNSPTKESVSKVKIRDIIDITKEVQNQNPGTTCAAVQISSKIIPVLNGKFKKVGGVINVKHLNNFVTLKTRGVAEFLPGGIINVKNITNNLVKMNGRTELSNPCQPQNGKIPLRPVTGGVHRSTVICVPSTSSINQQLASAIRNGKVPRNNTLIRVSPPQKYILPSRKDGVKNLSSTNSPAMNVKNPEPK